MRSQITGFQRDMTRFHRMTEEHFSEAEKEKYYMPQTFIIRPKHVTKENSSPSVSASASGSSSWLSRATSFAKRQYKSVVRLGWSSSEVVFICPVTMRPVEGAVFEITLPTKTLKNIAWGMKWGIVLVKIALATQVTIRIHCDFHPIIFLLLVFEYTVISLPSSSSSYIFSAPLASNS